MVKEISLEDISAFNALGNLVNKQFTALFSLKEILEKEYSHVFGYYIENKLVAFLHVEKSFDVVDIINIVVEPTHRRCGIAKQLLEHCFQTFPSVEEYVLEVKVTNKEAIVLYEKMGFEIINTRKGYYQGIDGYVMKRGV